MNTFYLNITASDKVFYKDQCIALIVPLDDGQKEVLAHHENMIIATVTGEIRLQHPDGTWHSAFVGNGFVQIMNNRVRMLVDTAERPEDIDERRAQEALERAEEQLRQKQSVMEHSHSEASLARALTRLRVKEKYV